MREPKPVIEAVQEILTVIDASVRKHNMRPPFVVVPDGYISMAWRDLRYDLHLGSLVTVDPRLKSIRVKGVPIIESDNVCFVHALYFEMFKMPEYKAVHYKQSWWKRLFKNKGKIYAKAVAWL